MKSNCSTYPGKASVSLLLANLENPSLGFERQRRGLFIETGCTMLSSSVGATCARCRSYGAEGLSCMFYKQAAPPALREPYSPMELSCLLLKVRITQTSRQDACAPSDEPIGRKL